MKFYLFGVFFMLMGQICPLSGDGGGGSSTGGEIDTSYFVQQALGATCSDRQNELYLVDGEFVIWYRSGRCPDNGYSVTLYDAKTQVAVCSSYDSIAGPRTSCTDESFRPLFDELAGGGKGMEGHTMELIPLE